MIKLGLVALIAIAMTSCGDKGDAQEIIELKTDKDSLSYILGAEQAKFILEKGDPNLQKLDFDEMAAGFETAILDKQEQMDQACQDALEKLYGRDGKDYDSTYRKQGSHCIGGIAGSIFLSRLEFERCIERCEYQNSACWFPSCSVATRYFDQ